MRAAIWFLAVTLAVTALAAPTATGAAAPKVGGSCTQVGKTATVTIKGARVSLRCVSTGKKKVWKVQAPAKSTTKPTPAPTKSTSTAAPAAIVTWQDFGDGKWMPTATPPSCDSLVWTLPLDGLAQVESILYPGQVRGEYKAHGGFRTRSNNIRVTSPTSFYLTSGTRHLVSPSGPGGATEVQYGIEMQHPCGFAVRIGHIKVPSPAVQAVFDQHIPMTPDSRFTWLATPVRLEAGDLLATVVGLTETEVNAFFDFGVYDLRSKTPSKRSEAELRAFGPAGELGLHGVCWFSFFGPVLEAQIRALPAADPKSGTQSDYC